MLVNQWLIQKYLFELRTGLSLALVRSYFSMSYLTFLERNSSKLLHVITQEVGSLVSYLQQLVILIAELFVLICILGLLLWFNPLMTLSAIVVMSIVSLLYIGIVKGYLYRTGVHYNHAYSQACLWVIQSFRGFKYIQISRTYAYFYEKIEHWLGYTEQAGRKSQFLQFLPRVIFELVFVIGLISFCISMILLNWTPQRMLVTLTLFGAAVFRLYPAFNKMTFALSLMKTQQVSLESISRDLLQTRPARASFKGDPIPFLHEINIKNLCFNYPTAAKSGLTDVSVTLHKGEKIGIIGKSGSGKSTLIDILLGVLLPASGEICVDGQAIDTQNPCWLNHIGYVPQEVILLDASILDNIAFGMEQTKETSPIIARCLKEAHLDTFVATLPEGIHTLIGENGAKLSGGQRQRLGIARALYHNPQILIFDEATSALDVETEALISNQIFEFGADKTVIIVAHRLSTIKRSDRVYVLEEGRCVDSGSFEELALRYGWPK